MASLQTILDAYTKAGRTAPDAEGLAYWQDPANNFETAFQGSVNDSTAQANAAKIDPVYGAKLNEVQTNYQNLFGRTGEGEGAAYWTGSGLTGSDLTNAMMKSADQIAAENPQGTGPSVSTYTSGGMGFNASGEPVKLNTQTTPTNQFPTTPVVPGSTSTPSPGTATKADTGGLIASAQKIQPVNAYTATKATLPDAMTAVEATKPTALKANKATTPAGYTAGQAAASTWTVDPDQTVDAQLNRILAQDSEFQQANVASAMGAANKRGVLNTTMAAGAGRLAGIQSAMPMAQQNADTYAKAAGQNAALGTDVSKFNAAERNTALLERFRMEGKNEQDFAAAQNAMDINDYNTSAKIAQDFAKTKNDMEVQTFVTKALNEQNFAAAANLAQQLKFQSDVAAAGGDAAAANALIMQSNTIQADVNKSYAEAQNAMARQQTDAALQTALQTLRGTQATSLAKIESDSRQAIQTSATTAQMFNTIVAAITESQRDTADNKTTAEQKAAALTGLTSLLKSGLAIAGGAGSSPIDLSTLLKWTPTEMTPAAPTPQANTATNLFKTLLGRDPEPAVLADLVARLKAGTVTEAEIRDGILKSPEYRARSVTPIGAPK